MARKMRGLTPVCPKCGSIDLTVGKKVSTCNRCSIMLPSRRFTEPPVDTSADDSDRDYLPGGGCRKVPVHPEYDYDD